MYEYLVKEPVLLTSRGSCNELGLESQPLHIVSRIPPVTSSSGGFWRADGVGLFVCLFVLFQIPTIVPGEGGDDYDRNTLVSRAPDEPIFVQFPPFVIADELTREGTFVVCDEVIR